MTTFAMRDAEAADLGRQFATVDHEHKLAPDSDAGIRARLDTCAVDEEITGWAQDAAVRAYRDEWRRREGAAAGGRSLAQERA